MRNRGKGETGLTYPIGGYQPHAPRYPRRTSRRLVIRVDDLANDLATCNYVARCIAEWELLVSINSLLASDCDRLNVAVVVYVHPFAHHAWVIAVGHIDGLADLIFGDFADANLAVRLEAGNLNKPAGDGIIELLLQSKKRLGKEIIRCAVIMVVVRENSCRIVGFHRFPLSLWFGMAPSDKTKIPPNSEFVNNIRL